MERHTDIYIGLLRRYIEAMGGVLDIIAHFPDGEVRINHFSHFLILRIKENHSHEFYRWLGLMMRACRQFIFFQS
ncbi:hypothetical protein QUF54_02280 [Candidatus Marithioploca araucensis]|uniref:Uncharacterized protein n=1 Tax=Candidatus Marithioploca araucensis TaxID=70273 RepID=A0ABT7VR72_9GAMM|nr:hypothetical protein [Candidatus Marithioploca araucensis]